MHFYCQGIICRFSFYTSKSTFPEYMRENRPLFYTFNEIMQQAFDKIKCGTTICTNIEKNWTFLMRWHLLIADPFILMRLSCLFPKTDASQPVPFNTFCSLKVPHLAAEYCLQPENKYQFTMFYKFSSGYKSLILHKRFMKESFANPRSCSQLL